MYIHAYIIIHTLYVYTLYKQYNYIYNYRYHVHIHVYMCIYTCSNYFLSVIN